ncbi:MAG: hypothetical protein ACE5PV_00970 [Candidatus Poribacteria bacterium]
MVKVPNPFIQDAFCLAKTAAECDCIINLPCLKVHKGERNGKTTLISLIFMMRDTGKMSFPAFINFSDRLLILSGQAIKLNTFYLSNFGGTPGESFLRAPARLD